MHCFLFLPTRFSLPCNFPLLYIPPCTFLLFLTLSSLCACSLLFHLPSLQCRYLIFFLFLPNYPIVPLIYILSMYFFFNFSLLCNFFFSVPCPSLWPKFEPSSRPEHTSYVITVFMDKLYFSGAKFSSPIVTEMSTETTRTFSVYFQLYLCFFFIPLPVLTPSIIAIINVY